MSGMFNFFRSYLTVSPASSNDQNQRGGHVPGNDYDISLETTIAIRSPSVGDNATNTGLSILAIPTANTTVNTDVKIMEQSKPIHEACAVTSPPQKTTNLDAKQQQDEKEKAELEHFLNRRISGYSDTHNLELASKDKQPEQTPLRSKLLHQEITRNDDKFGGDNDADGNENSKYFDAAMTTPETQPLRDTEYQHTSDNIDTLLQTQPTTTRLKQTITRNNNKVGGSNVDGNEDSDYFDATMNILEEYQHTSGNIDPLLQTQPATTAIEQFTEVKDDNVTTQDEIFSPLQTQPDLIQTASQISPPRTCIATQRESEIPAKSKSIESEKIPIIDDATKNVTSIHELDLRTKTLTLGLARVRLIWPLQKIKRNKNSLGTRRHDFGPAFFGFKYVLSMEVMELEDPRPIIVDVGTEDERCNIVRQTAARAFSNIVSPTTPALALESAQIKRKIRRTRVFLYDSYAIQMHHLLEELERGTPARTRDPDMKKKVLQDLFVVSLRNTPALCIFPFKDFPLEERTTGLLNDDFGRLSRYCICVGGESKILLEDMNDALRFDSEDFEMRVLKLVEYSDNNKHLTMVKNFEGEEKEYLITRSNGIGSKKPALVKSSGMAERYSKIHSRQNTNTREEIQEEVQGDISSNKNSPNRLCRKRKTPSTEYHTLLQLNEIIQSNRDISQNHVLVNVFGAVLAIQPPQLTKAQQWMMRIMLTDDSNPIDASTTSPKTQIAPVTLLIFQRKYDELPKVFCAGDILRIHRVKLQKWSNGAQLLGRTMSSYVVCRPVANIFQQYLRERNSIRQTVPSDNINHWQVHNVKQTPVDFLRTSELWRWAQERLAKGPTINEKFHTNISQMVPPYSGQFTHGDLTVMITNIIPIPPRHGSHYLPKGFLRVWDGSGHPISDKQPTTSSESNRLSDPPSQALSSIANIIGMIPFREIDASAFAPPKKLCGRVINVAIWEDSYWDLIIGAKMFVKVGTFLRLRNVRRNFGPLSTGNQEVFGLSVDSNAMLTPLPNYTYEVGKLLIEHNTRIMQKHDFNPNSGCLPLELRKNFGKQKDLSWYRGKFPHDSNECTLLQCMMGKVYCHSKVRFAIKNVFPSFDKENSGMIALCTKKRGRSNEGSQIENKVYQFTMRIFDATSEIDIIVSDSAGEQLIGIASTDLSNEANNLKYTRKHKEAIEKLCFCIENSVLYRGTIQSVIVDGAKYFVLHSINPLDIEATCNNYTNC